MNLLYPITSEGETTYLPREDYIPIRWGQIAKEIEDFPLRKFKDALEAVENGFKYVGEDIQQRKIYDAFQWDMATAKKESEKVIDNEKRCELAVIEGAMAPLNIGQGLGNVLRDFDLGENLTQCLPRNGSMTDQQLGEAFRVAAGTGDWARWAKGDIVNEIEKRGHNNAVASICSSLNMEDSYQTISKYSRTASAIKPSQRGKPNLTFSHYAEISCSRFSKDLIEQERIVSEVLQEASENALNVAATRESCLARQGKETTPTPPPAKKWRWLIIESCADGKFMFTDKEPEAGSGQWAIDVEDRVYSAADGTHLHAWIPIAAIESEVKVAEPQLEEV